MWKPKLHRESVALIVDSEPGGKLIYILFCLLRSPLPHLLLCLRQPDRKATLHLPWRLPLPRIALALRPLPASLSAPREALLLPQHLCPFLPLKRSKTPKHPEEALLPSRPPLRTSCPLLLRPVLQRPQSQLLLPPLRSRLLPPRRPLVLWQLVLTLSVLSVLFSPSLPCFKLT